METSGAAFAAALPAELGDRECDVAWQRCASSGRL